MEEPTVATEEPTVKQRKQKCPWRNQRTGLPVWRVAVSWVLALRVVPTSGAAWGWQRLLEPSSPAHLAHPLNIQNSPRNKVSSYTQICMSAIHRCEEQNLVLKDFFQKTRFSKLTRRDVLLLPVRPVLLQGNASGEVKVKVRCTRVLFSRFIRPWRDPFSGIPESGPPHASPNDNDSTFTNTKIKECCASITNYQVSASSVGFLAQCTHGMHTGLTFY